MVCDGRYCVSFVFFGHIFEDLGNILRHINFYLLLCLVVQLSSELIADLLSVDFQVYVFYVSFTKLGDHLFDRIAFHVGYFWVVNLPQHSGLIAAHCFVGHTPIVWVYLKAPLLEARV